ncbi:MAG: hemerythrin family protein [Nitrospinae bacterium]|nr:hemerythrin family protein [Nitrospinota bacterium]
MAFIPWEEKYSVGIKSIDDQHKKLFGMVNELSEAIPQGKGKEITGKILDELVKYTVSHFATEEEYFKKFAYPNTAAHKKEHDELTKQASDVLNNFNSGKAVLSMAVMVFLKDWLYNHILKTDMLYKDYLIGKGVK